MRADIISPITMEDQFLNSIIHTTIAGIDLAIFMSYDRVTWLTNLLSGSCAAGYIFGKVM